MSARISVDWQDVITIARFDIARRLRSMYSLVALLVLGVGSALTGRLLGTYAAKAREWVKLADSQDVASLDTLGSASVAVETLMELLRAHPPLLLGLFSVTLLMVPAMALVFAHNQIASDIHTKHARFVVFRSTRDSLYLGKTISAFTTIVVVTSVCVLLLGGLYMTTCPAEERGDAVLYLLRIWGTVSLASLPFITFLGLLNAIFSRGWLSVLMCFTTWAGLAIAGFILGAIEPSLDQTQWLFPSYERYMLATDTAGLQWTTWVHGLVFSVLTLLAGMHWFRRRDL